MWLECVHFPLQERSVKKWKIQLTIKSWIKFRNNSVATSNNALSWRYGSWNKNDSKEIVNVSVIDIMTRTKAEHTMHAGLGLCRWLLRLRDAPLWLEKEPTPSFQDWVQPPVPTELITVDLRRTGSVQQEPEFCPTETLLYCPDSRS